MAGLAAQHEAEKLEAVKQERAAVSGEMQTLREQGARLRREVDDAKREVGQRRSAASAAAIKASDVHDAGEKLKTADVGDVLRECARQGWACRVVK